MFQTQSSKSHFFKKKSFEKPLLSQSLAKTTQSLNTENVHFPPPDLFPPLIFFLYFSYFSPRYFTFLHVSKTIPIIPINTSFFYTSAIYYLSICSYSHPSSPYQKLFLLSQQLSQFNPCYNNDPVSGVLQGLTLF